LIKQKKEQSRDVIINGHVPVFPNVKDYAAITEGESHLSVSGGSSDMMKSREAMSIAMSINIYIFYLKKLL